MSLISTACGSIALIAAIGWAGQDKAPADRIRSLSDSVVGSLKNEKLTARQQRGEFESALKKAVDWTTVQKLVLARNFKNFSEDQRKRFVEEFQNHLVHTYWSSTDSVKLQSIEVQKDRKEDNGDWTVFTKFTVDDGTSSVIYRMRKTGEGDAAEWKVIDVLVEGISLVANFRSQFNSLLSDEDPDHVIDLLKKKNEEAEARFAEHEGDK